MRRWIPLLLACSFVLVQAGWACAQGKQAASGADSTSKDVPAKIDPSQSKTKQNTESLVLPVPSELVRQIQQSSYGAKLSASINPRLHKYEGMPDWQAALTLGASISDLLLALQMVPDDKIQVGLDDVLAGMKRLKLPEAQVSQLSALRADFASKKISKPKLVEGFDGMRADVVNFGRLSLGSQNYGLLIVGGWASGSYMTARAARAYPDALENLQTLKMRSVIQTLLHLVGNGPDVTKVVASLDLLMPITVEGRPPAPTKQEAAIIETATGQIISLLGQ